MDATSVIQITRYIYLDNPGLESMWAQASDRLELEVQTTRERGKAGKLSASIGLGRALGALIGLAGVNGSAEAELSTKSVDTIKSTLAPEQKLKILTASLIEAGPPTFYDDFDAAASAAAALDDAVFCLARGLFDAPQFYGSGDGVQVANAMGALVFERNRRPEGTVDPYEAGDHYYRPTSKPSTGAPIIMAASLTKCMSASNGLLGNTSHEGVMLRQHAGMDVKLGVFGSLFRIPGAFQIKPYAIWV